MADSVEDPEKFEAAGFERFGGAKDGFEISFGALIAEKHHADGESDFGVDDVLHEELFGAGEVDRRPIHPAISHIPVPPVAKRMPKAKKKETKDARRSGAPVDLNPR